MNFTISYLLNKLELNRNRDFNNLDDFTKGLILNLKANNLTYLSNERLASIARECQRIESKCISGSILEAGCALGGSSILIAKMKRSNRPFFIYDVFGMIPPPTGKDGIDVNKRYQDIKKGKSKGLGKDKYYGYENNLFQKVSNNLAGYGIYENQNGVRLIRGLIQQTMKVNNEVSLAHIDVDWYEPVKISLERIIPNLVIGGCVILDDFNDWSGCHQATNEFFKGRKEEFKFDDSAGSLRIVRIRK